jgi:hypothetical protein
MSEKDGFSDRQSESEEMAWDAYRRSRPDEPADAWLAEDLTDQPPVVRLVQAAARMRTIGADPAAPLVEALYDANDEVCKAAARTLIQLYVEDAEHTPQLLKAIRLALLHPNLAVQEAAIAELGNSTDVSLVPTLIAALHGRQVGSNRFVVAALVIASLVVGWGLLFALKSPWGIVGVLATIGFFYVSWVKSPVKAGVAENVLLHHLTSIAERSPVALERSRAALTDLASPILTRDAQVRQSAKNVLRRLEIAKTETAQLPIGAEIPERDATELPVAPS